MKPWAVQSLLEAIHDDSHDVGPATLQALLCKDDVLLGHDPGIQNEDNAVNRWSQQQGVIDRQDGR